MPDATAMNSYDSALYVADFGTAAPNGLPPGVGWTEIAEVISVSGLPRNPSVTRVTHLRSTDKAQEKIPGFTDAGQLTVRLNYSVDNLLAQKALWPTEAVTAPGWGRKEFLLVAPDGGSYYFTGFVVGQPIEIPEDDRLTTEMTIEVSGDIDFFLL